LRRSIDLAAQQGDRWQHVLSSLECARIEMKCGEAGGARRLSEAEGIYLDAENRIQQMISGRAFLT
jgi:hypothetical protein